MSKRDYLKRLEPEQYQGDAIVHWTLTMRDRKTGWLNAVFLYRFRELLTHSCFRYGLVCPVFCLMPDHVHMLWMGITKSCDQLPGMKHFRKTLNESLRRIGFQMQDQPYDHVLTDDERKESGFRAMCDYILRNPERAGLVKPDSFASYKFSGCVIPGYPELRFFEPDFWDRFDRIISFLRKEGLTRS